MKNEYLLQKILGYLLLTPSLLSVFCFLIDLINGKNEDVFSNLSWKWIGYGENHTSSLPLYFGLMAIAGVYLLKDKK